MDFNQTINSSIQGQDDIDQTSIVRTSALVICLVVNIWICLLFKTALFSVSMMNLSLVNQMIMLDESVKMIMLFGQSFLVYHYIAGGGGKLSETIFGTWCGILLFSSHMGIVTSYFGGAAIATVRLIHIKHQWILEKFGKLWTVMGLQALQVACISMVIYKKYHKLQNREVSLQDCFPAIEINDKVGRRNLFVVLASLLFVTVIEVLIYLSIFHYLYKHNKSMRLVSSEKNVKKAIRKNAIDLFTHFLHFIAEIFIIVCSVIANVTSNQNFKTLSLCAFVFQNGLLSLLLILTSSTLRDKAMEIFISSRNHLFGSIAMLCTSVIIMLVLALPNIAPYLISNLIFHLTFLCAFLAFLYAHKFLK